MPSKARSPRCFLPQLYSWPEGQWFVHQHSGEEGKTQDTKILHTAALLETNYYIIFVQKCRIQERLRPSQNAMKELEAANVGRCYRQETDFEILLMCTWASRICHLAQMTQKSN